MKWILVILLTPIYFIIQIFRKFIKYSLEITEPVAEGMGIIMDKMYKFWFENKKEWFYEEEKQHDEYWNSLGRELGYTGENCINCGKNRVIKYSKGKRICEKCSYDQDKKEYDFEYNKYI